MQNERLTAAKTRLKAYYEAEMTVLSGQAYTIGTRSLTRANLSEIRRAIHELENMVESLENGNGKRITKRVIPRDL